MAILNCSFVNHLTLQGHYCPTKGLTVLTQPLCNAGHLCNRGCVTGAPTSGCGEACPTGQYCTEGKDRVGPDKRSGFKLATNNQKVRYNRYLVECM